MDRPLFTRTTRNELGTHESSETRAVMPEVEIDHNILNRWFVQDGNENIQQALGS